MDKAAQSRFALPNDEQWVELRQALKLSDAGLTALNTTLQEVEYLCRDLAADLAKSQVKRSLKVLDRLLSNTRRALQRADICQALGTIEFHGRLSAILSSEAGTAIHGQTHLDSLNHDRLLNERTQEVMSYLLGEMQRPIAEWLAVAAKDKGGNRPKSHRQALLLLLARDSMKIIGTGPTTTPNGKFHQLCSWVLPLCGIGSDGLEEAIGRCLNKHAKWLEWAQLPTGEHIVGQLSEAEIAVIPDDLEEKDPTW